MKKSILYYIVFLTVSLFFYSVKLAESAGETPEKPDLILIQIETDMLYGTDDYFGEYRDLIELENIGLSSEGYTSDEPTCPT